MPGGQTEGHCHSFYRIVRFGLRPVGRRSVARCFEPGLSGTVTPLIAAMHFVVMSGVGTIERRFNWKCRRSRTRIVYLASCEGDKVSARCGLRGIVKFAIQWGPERQAIAGSQMVFDRALAEQHYPAKHPDALAA